MNRAEPPEACRSGHHVACRGTRLVARENMEKGRKMLALCYACILRPFGRFFSFYMIGERAEDSSGANGRSSGCNAGSLRVTSARLCRLCRFAASGFGEALSAMPVRIVWLWRGSVGYAGSHRVASARSWRLCRFASYGFGGALGSNKVSWPGPFAKGILARRGWSGGCRGVPRRGKSRVETMDV